MENNPVGILSLNPNIIEAIDVSDSLQPKQLSKYVLTGNCAIGLEIINNTIYANDQFTFQKININGRELSIVKSVDKTNVSSGDTVTVTLTVKNASPNSVHSLIVTDSILSGTHYVANSAQVNGASVTDGSDTDAYINSGTPTWNFTNIAPTSITGDTITLTYQVQVN